MHSFRVSLCLACALMHKFHKAVDKKRIIDESVVRMVFSLLHIATCFSWVQINERDRAAMHFPTTKA
jgi:hypothetical protein